MTIPAVDYHFVSSSSAGQAGRSVVERLIVDLIAQGGVVKSSGDGTTYNSSGWGGLGTLTGALAWVRIAGVGWELIFQRQNNSGTSPTSSWNLWYSTAGFTGGSPSGTVIPTATDGRCICGGGGSVTPLSPAPLFPSSDGDWYANIIVLPGCTGFALLAYKSAVSLFPCTVIAVDPLQAGTYDASETDPHNLYCGYNSAGGVLIQSPNWLNAGGVTNAYGSSANAATGGPRAWINKPGGGDMMGVGVIGANDAGSTAIWPRQLGVNPLTGKDPLKWVDWGRVSTLTAPTGPKGKSSLFKLLLTNRAQQDLMNLVTAGDHLVVGDLVVVWNGTATGGSSWNAELLLDPAGPVVVYKMNGKYVAGGNVIEPWTQTSATAPATNPLTGHAVTDVHIVGQL